MAKLVMKELLKILGFGIGGGLLLTPIVLKPIIPFLYEVELIDIGTYSLVISVLLVASLLATIVPFRNALTVNPVKILRGD